MPEIPTPLDTNDLLRHSEFTLQIHGNKTAWIRSISDTSGHTIVSAALGNVTVFGPLDTVRERLGALVGLLDAATAQPGLWPDIALTRVGERRWRRDRPNPFVDYGRQ